MSLPFPPKFIQKTLSKRKAKKMRNAQQDDSKSDIGPLQPTPQEREMLNDKRVLVAKPEHEAAICDITDCLESFTDPEIVTDYMCSVCTSGFSVS